MAGAHGENLNTEQLAYRYWQQRGCPVGSPDDDWFRAERELRGQGDADPPPLPPGGVERWVHKDTRASRAKPRR